MLTPESLLQSRGNQDGHIRRRVRGCKMGNSGVRRVILALRTGHLPLDELVTVVFVIASFGDSLAIRKES